MFTTPQALIVVSADAQFIELYAIYSTNTQENYETALQGPRRGFPPWPQIRRTRHTDEKIPSGGDFLVLRILAERVGFAHIPRAALARVRARLCIPRVRRAGGALLSAPQIKKLPCGSYFIYSWRRGWDSPTFRGPPLREYAQGFVSHACAAQAAHSSPRHK